MSETQVLLTRITALRQQLERATELTKDAHATGAAWLEADTGQEDGMRCLERHVAEGSTQSLLLDSALRQLTPASAVQDAAPLPRQLTARTRRILEQGRELLNQLRVLADALEPDQETGRDGDPRVPDTPLEQHWKGPFTRRYQETVAMANTALRIVQAFPDAATAQLPLCEGLEAILEVVAERTAGMTAVLGQRRREAEQVQSLARLLSALYAKEPVAIDSFVCLAEPILRDAQQAVALRFFYARPEQPAQFVASHSLTVAQVMARVVRHDPDFRGNPLEPILAALLHDAGMLGVPPSILTQAEPLDDPQRRILEAHTSLGAEMMMRLLPAGSWLAEAAAGHHERLDGTGYPAGRKEAQLQPLTRLLAVCDVYAALCVARPHRPALDTRTALTDTLLLAEQGALDRYHAERLLQLSFYPVGSVVELADGAFGIVVATPQRGAQSAEGGALRALRSALCAPVVALLTDTQRRRLPVPHHVDLAECEDRSIVRTVPQAERGTVLGSRYPELV
jgi:HD-GYP domain-containing protein (c-di-GMP phosphodiesterase class II)